MPLLASARARLAGMRARLPVVDHAVRTYERADEVLWGRLAASVTYFGFLSLFPLLALGFALLGFLTGVYPDVQERVEREISAAFPGLLGTGEGRIDVTTFRDAAAGAGLIGLAALLWTGTGFVDAVRDAIRVVFGTQRLELSLPKKKLRDVLALAIVGLLLLTSVALSTVTTSLTSDLLEIVDLQDSLLATVLLRVLSVGLALLLDMAVLSVLIRGLCGKRLTWRQLRGGVLLGAILLEILKLFATQLLASTTSNPLYATFAVVVGLLLWINYSARVLVISAAWVATARGVVLGDEPAREVTAEALPLLVVPAGADDGAGWWGRLATVSVLVAGLRAARRR